MYPLAGEVATSLWLVVNAGDLAMKVEGGASNATGLAAEVEVELVDEEDDEADAVLAVLWGIGINVGIIGELGAGEEAGDVTGVAFAPAGRTRAMSPFGSLVGTT